MLTQFLWPNSRNLKDENGKRVKFISNKDLYDFVGTRSLYDTYDVVRGKFIGNAEVHENKLIRLIIGGKSAEEVALEENAWIIL